MAKEDTPEVIPRGEVGETEAEARRQAGFKALVMNVVESERAKFWDGATEMLRKMEIPDRSPVPDFRNKADEPVARLVSPTEPLYRRLSAEERAIRTPDGDHWMAEWIRGNVYGDSARMFQSSAELETLFPDPKRATTTEGTAGASGAISTGTGGALVPRPLEAAVLIARDRVAKMRRFAQSMTMTAQTHTVPTAAAMTAYMTAEGATATQGEPTMASVQLTARKGQVTAVATEEILNDAAINLVNIYAARGGGALGKLEDDQFFSDGDGTAPNISACILGTAYSETTSAALSYTDLLGMYYTVGQAYRQNAVWMAASNVLQLLAALRDGDNRPFYQGLVNAPAPISDDPTAEGTLLRRPVYEVPFPDGSMLFGDVNACYIVGTRQGLQSKASEHVKFDSDEVMWKITQRFDGINVDAVAAYTVAGITSVNTV
jgi:HK97 family phage major capsid protein